jgi:hypothetical protein
MELSGFGGGRNLRPHRLFQLAEVETESRGGSEKSKYVQKKFTQAYSEISPKEPVSAQI